MQKDKILLNSKNAQKFADLIFPRTNYFVLCPSGHNIGHLVQEYILAATISKKFKKKLVLIEPINSCNSEILNIIPENICVIKKGIRVALLKILISIITLKIKLNNFFHKILKKLFNKSFFTLVHNPYPVCIGFEENKKYFRKLIGSNYYYDSDLMSKRPSFELSYKQNNISEKLYKQTGLQKNDWFVCLHIREGNYAGYSQIRSCSIENYYPTIKFINKLGGKVIKMGDSTMKKVPKEIELIDYANSDYKSDLLDLYLIKNCNFFLGCSSGLAMLALLFKKDVICVNFHDFIGAFFGNTKAILFKNFYEKKNRKKLDFIDFIKSPDYEIYVKNFSSKTSDNFYLEENNADQIFNLVKNYLNKKDLFDKNYNLSFKKDLETIHKQIISKKDISPMLIDYIEGTINTKTNLVV